MEQTRLQLFASTLLCWHGGQSSWVYSVSSRWLAGHKVMPDDIRSAARELDEALSSDADHITESEHGQLSTLVRALYAMAEVCGEDC